MKKNDFFILGAIFLVPDKILNMTDSNCDPEAWKLLLADNNVVKMSEIRRGKQYSSFIVELHQLIGDPDFFAEHQDKVAVQLHLGDMCYHTQKHPEAYEWYLQAARQNDRIAMAALLWFLGQKKAKTGQDWCQILSLMYLLGTEQDMGKFDESVQFLEKRCPQHPVATATKADRDALIVAARSFYEEKN